jgi:hypothetical protein
MFARSRGEYHLLKVIPVEGAEFTREGHGNLALGYETHVFVAISTLHDAGDTVIVVKVLVVGKLVPDPEADEHDHGHSDGEPGNVDERKQFICPEAAPGNRYIILEHAGDLSGISHRECQIYRNLILNVLKRLLRCVCPVLIRAVYERIVYAGAR